MNAGARAARADVLLFLHADTQLAPGALRRHLRKDARPASRRRGIRAALRLALASARAHLPAGDGPQSAVGRHLGDQAMFVRANVFRELGGFAEIADL